MDTKEKFRISVKTTLREISVGKGLEKTLGRRWMRPVDAKTLIADLIVSSHIIANHIYISISIYGTVIS